MPTPEITRLAAMLRKADAVVIAASNGFDIADGYNQFACDETFLQRFGDFHAAYGLNSMLHGLAARWPSDEARWAFLARLISYGFVAYEPSEAMRALDELTAGKPRLVVTCNCNGRFERTGFSPIALLETEGSYARLRCADGCADEDYDALPYVERLFPAAEKSLVVPSELVPRCPRCGAPLAPAVDDTGRLASTGRFRAQQARFQAFLRMHGAQNLLVLELGVGQRNRAIKQPLMAFAAQAPHASYAVLNRDEAVLPNLPAVRTVAVAGNLGAALAELRELLAGAAVSPAEERPSAPATQTESGREGACA